MRQLITRIDDELHRRLKQKARDEGRSMNSLVTEALVEAVADHETPLERLDRRAAAAGITFVHGPPPEGPVPTWEELDAENRGARVSDLIERDRAER
jgi:hypothetical protein